jgi:DNA polymerase I-like protein with 3'-5' exonuclease and polymerase domains
MLISCDASQLEFRVAVELSGDQVGLYEIREKQDIHSLNQAAFGLPTRLIAKIYLFRTIFRGSGWAFANDPEFSHVSSSAKFWDNINEKFFAKYAGLDAWHQRLAGEVMQGNAIVGPLGRQWTINIPRGRTGEIKVPWTTLSNYPVNCSGFYWQQ